MKNSILGGFIALFLVATSAVAFGQKPTDNTALLPCAKAVPQAKKALQAQANAECRTVYQCVECLDDKTKQKTCKSVAGQPQRNTCASAVDITRRGNTLQGGKNTTADPAPPKEAFNVEIFQSSCYNGGVSLEAVVVKDGQMSPDGKAQNDGYAFLWELDGGKGGHASAIFCTDAKTAKVQVTKIATGESVTRETSLAIPVPASRPAARPAARPALPEDRVLAYRKTGCFGKCPVYEVNLYADGTVTWEGILYTGSQGTDKKKVSQEVVNNILQDAQNLGFFELNDRYPDYQVWDAPSTILYINAGGEKAKQVVYTSVEEAPKAFANVMAQMEEVITGLGWKTTMPNTPKELKPTAKNTNKN